MNLSDHDKRRISASILDKFERVARSPEGLFRYPTGEEGLAGLGYPDIMAEPLAGLPATVRTHFCGVGNPFALGVPTAGARVLDVGCGAGVDTLLAALAVGPDGFALGVEFSPAMLERARNNMRESGVANASFEQGSAEALPVEDASVDLLISSGVYNLVVDKDKALAEAWRVLKPGGRLQVADQMLRSPPAGLAGLSLGQACAIEADPVSSWHA